MKAELRHAIDVFRAYRCGGDTYANAPLLEDVANDAEHTLARVTGATPPARHCKTTLAAALAEIYSELVICCRLSEGTFLGPLSARRKAAALLGVDLKTFNYRRKG